MKKYSLRFLFPVLLLSVLASPADAYTILDNYWGGTPTSNYANRDVIGDANKFDIASMDVSFSGINLNIAITGNYFSAYSTGGAYNMKPGDLFISTKGWDMAGMTAPYAGDTSATGQQWNYALDLGDNANLGTTGTVSLYSLGQGTVSQSNIAGIQPPGTYIFRQPQEWAFTPDQGAANIPLATGSWVISGNQLIFSIDASSLSFSGEGIGVHWTMQCGNDVIEGVAPVPEPSTMLLLGTGLAGLWGVGKRRKGRKA